MPLLLLHGAIGSSEQLKPLRAELIKSGFNAQLFDFVGHGGRKMPDEDFSIALFANEVIRCMNDHHISTIDIFGYSMGGYVGLYMAKHFPERVGKILTVATKLEWSIAIAERETKMLNPEKIAEKVPKFAETLAARHAPSDWKEVLVHTGKMMIEMGAHPPMMDRDFSEIKQRVLLCVGDKDTMVSQDETHHVSVVLPNAEMKILPDTPHPIEQMDVRLLAKTAEDFFIS